MLLVNKAILTYGQITMSVQVTLSLTVNEQKVLDFILSHQERENRTPNNREVAEGLGLKSQTSVLQYWRVLERKGAIERLPGKARSVVVKHVARPEEGRTVFRDVQGVTVEGDISAGMPADAPPHRGDVLPIHAALMGLSAASQPFALRVRGDSMTGAGIHSGDYVVLDRTREPRHNDIVAALVDGESTLKRLVIGGGQTFLKAENPAYPDLRLVRDLVVQGVMVGLVRGAGDGSVTV